MTRAGGAMWRTLLIAHNTLREAARQRLFQLLLGLAAALVVGVQWFRDFNFGSSELKFIADFGFGAMTFFGAALAITATAQLFFSEIEHRTVLTLLAKPVGRAEFVLGKFLGVAAVTAVFCALLTAALAAVLWTREGALMREFPDGFPHGRVVDYADLALVGLMHWLKLGVLAALTLLVASFAQTQLFTVGCGFFLLLICHLQYLAQDTAARGGTWLARGFAGVIALLFPNFQLFDFAGVLAAGEAWPWARLAGVALYALGYMAAVMALAAFSFRSREI